MPRNRQDREKRLQEFRDRRDMRRDMRQDRARRNQPRNRYGQFTDRTGAMNMNDGHYPPYYQGGVEPYLNSIYNGNDYAGNSRDMARDRERDMARDRMRDQQRDIERDRVRDEARDRERDMARDRERDRERDRQKEGAENGKTLSEEELKEWDKELLNELDPQAKEMFSKEKIMRRAEMMGIKSDDFTTDELYTTALMLFSDYKNTVGTGNVESYVRMAKDFLEDKDAGIKGGEKLAVYYDEIVCADMEE